MSLAPGARLGPYEIVAAIGAGGMGEVYRARDTRLDRAVAIKVLPDAVAADPERLARFEREAKTLAALNHSNVAQVYGLEGGALAMEFVEGRDLSALIAEGPIPVDEVIAIARQIADALEAAHHAGIIHRDLKPSNVRVRDDGTVKVLDFGLAKALAPASSALDATAAPTITSPAMTQQGVILGTAGYMSPEQARGRPADQRADIWAFGVVVYEMATGRRAFDGENVSDVLAAIIKTEPDWTPVPPRLLRLLKGCLDKDPKRRLRDIGDWWRQLDEEPAGTPPDVRRRLAWLPWAVAAGLLVAAGTLAVVHFREKTPAVEPVRFLIHPPEKAAFETALAVAPNGRRVAFTAKGDDGVVRVWIRDLDVTDARPVAGTEGARTVFWSPDSRTIGFTTGRTMRKVSAEGGPVTTVVEAEFADQMGGGAWGEDGTILVGGYRAAPIRRVPEAGGAATPVTAIDRSREDRVHGLAAFLPDRRHFLYVRVSTAAENSGLFIGSLDRAPANQDLTRLLEASQTAYVPTGPTRGLLVYLQRGTLMARPFDAARMVLAGDAMPIAERVGNFGAAGFFSATATALVYRSGATVGAGRDWQLTWLDRQGRASTTVGDSGFYESVTLSPDGARAAATVGGMIPAGIGNLDVWVLELARGVAQRLTFDSGIERFPMWSPSGDRVIFSSTRDGGRSDLYVRASDGSGADQLLLTTDAPKTASSWSRDGRFVLFTATSPTTGDDIWLLPLFGDRTPVPLVQSSFAESAARWSPDMRWISYTSNASGRFEIYVRPCNPVSPGAVFGAVTQVSQNGGVAPRWRRDGKELYYVTPAGAVTAVEISGSTLTLGAPKTLFTLPAGAPWDVAPDGQRFLVGMPPAAAALTPITVVLNWTSVLR